MGQKSYSVGLFALVFMFWPASLLAKDTTVTGKVVYSFSDDYYIVQSGSEVWQLRAKDVKKADRAKMSKPGTEVSIQVPDRALSTYWDVRDVKVAEKIPAEYEKLRSVASTDEMGKLGMKVDGKVILSFTDSHALVQSNDRVLMVKKNMLSPEQLKLLSQVGQSVTLNLPPKSFETLWTFRTAEAPVQTEVKDEGVKKLADGVHQIKGTVMHSFENDVSFVLANGFVFKLKQPVDTTRDSHLVNGSKFSRVIRDDDVIFAWAVPNAIDMDIRSPASK